MIIYHGQADPVFSINDTIRWYTGSNANLDGRAGANVRLFAVPGMTPLPATVLHSTSSTR